MLYFFFCVFLDTGHQMLIDVHGKTKEEIMEHLIKVVGKTKWVIFVKTVDSSRYVEVLQGCIGGGSFSERKER